MYKSMFIENHHITLLPTTMEVHMFLFLLMEVHMQFKATMEVHTRLDNKRGISETGSGTREIPRDIPRRRGH